MPTVLDTDSGLHLPSENWGTRRIHCPVRTLVSRLVELSLFLEVGTRCSESTPQREIMNPIVCG